MKVPTWILQAVLAAALAGEAWIVKTVIDMKVEIAEIKTAVNHNPQLTEK